ncbi:MAG: MFS transporter [Oscillospiraceae bacterium]
MSDNINTKKIPLNFLLSNLAQSFGVTVPMTYLIFFMTDSALITPVIMGGILLVSRIVDLVFSFLAGGVIQKTQMKWGQFRSWLLVVPPLVLLGSFLSFINPNIPLLGKALIIGVGYILTNAPMNFIVAAQYGLMAKVAGSSIDTRMKISARMMQGMNAGMLICSMITLPLITLADKLNFTNGYLIVAVVFGLINVGGQFFLFKATSEFDKFNPNLKDIAGSSANVNTKTMVFDTLKNGQILLLLAVDIMRMTGMFTISAVMTYYYSYIAGDFSLMTVALTVQSIAALFGAIVMPPVAAKIGKKHSSIISGIVAGLAYVVLGLFGQNHWMIYVACSAVAALGLAIVGSCGSNLYLDAAEYQLYKTGKDNRTFAMSLMSVPMKIGMAISSVVIAWILTTCGYQAATGIADPSKFVMIAGMLPGALYGISGVLMFLFKINEQKSREYAESNQKAFDDKAKAVEMQSQK